MQASKIFNLSMQELKKAVREVFEIKGCAPTETGGSIHCDVKEASYTARFADTKNGTEVAISVEPKKSFLQNIIKKKETFDPGEEANRVLKYIELKLPSNARIDGFVAEILKGSKTKIPDFIEVKIKPGGIISIKDIEKNSTRELVAPKANILKGGYFILEGESR